MTWKKSYTNKECAMTLLLITCVKNNLYGVVNNHSCTLVSYYKQDRGFHFHVR